MKVKDLNLLLDNMESQIERLSKDPFLLDLIENYDKLITESGYFFSKNMPNGIINDMNDMIGDIYSIREDIKGKIADNSQDLEL